MAAEGSGLTILQVLSWLDYGGVERYVLRLGQALHARGHRVLVASSGGPLESEFAAAGIEHIRLNFTGGRLLTGACALRRLLEREQVDLVNAHNWRAGLVTSLAARRAGVPYVLTVHGRRKARNHFGIAAWSKMVAVVSEASRRNLVDDFGLPEARVAVLPLGVDCAQFRPGPPDPSLEAELGLRPGAPRVVHVSRYSRAKTRVALALIDAAEQLLPEMPQLEVVLVGQGPGARQVAEAAQRANARAGRTLVHALPARPDIRAVLNLGDVVVATASVALEAMACGKPVVAAGKGGYLGVLTAEALPRAEATCFGDHQALSPVSPERLAADVRRLLQDRDLAARLGQHHRAAVVARADLSVMGESAEDLYRRVLTDRTARRIAVFHLNQIGDLVFTLPALRALREGFPEAHLTSVVRPHLAELLTDSGLVDEVIRRARGGPLGAVGLGLALRRRRPDLAVVLSQSASMAFAAWLSGAGHRIGYLDSDLCRFLNHRVQERGIPCPAKVLHLVRCLGLTPAQPEYVGLVRVSAEDEAVGAKLLAEARLEGLGPLVALAPGESTDRPYKSWTATGFAAVAATLAEELEVRLVVVGGTRDRALGEEILAGLGPRGVNLAGRTSPSELAAVLGRCDALIGIDSGPLHLAAAQEVPVVGLFGPTDPDRTGPQGVGHEVLSHPQPCGPCMTPTCQDRACMRSITVEEVLGAARRVLQATGVRGQRPAAGARGHDGR